MANPTCTKASLNLACFDDTVLSPIMRKVFMIYFKSLELNAIGGTNYTNNLIGSAAGGLVGDTVAFCDEKVSLDNIGTRYVGTWQLAISYNTAVNAGGNPQSTNAAIMPNVACLMNVNESLLDRMNLFLECQLGSHKTYPQ